MHIGFRTSGGRGEYEIVAGHAGQAASGLEGWFFYMNWPDGITRDTELWLDPGDSGKPRLRSVADQSFQIGRQVAAMLLLPDPRRSLSDVGDSPVILQHKQYLVTLVGFGPGTAFASPPEHVYFDPNFIEVRNRRHSELLGVQQRVARIEQIYAVAADEPPRVRDFLLAHQAELATGNPVKVSLTQIVTGLMKALAKVDTAYVQGSDPLPTLERRRGLLPPRAPDLPAPDEIGEDEPEIRARSAFQHRQSKSRGPEGKKFGDMVRDAYSNRCAFCGLVLGGLPGTRSGVDAAHILAWSTYDLDVVSNGIALCKNHHWAFDAGFMMPVPKGSGYEIRFTESAAALDPASRALLGTDGQVIPDEWLPADPALRPSKKYLERLYDDLLIAF